MIVICYRRIGNRKNGSFTNETKNKRRIIYYEENRAESCSCCSDEQKVLFQLWIDNRENAEITEKVYKELIPLCEKCSCDTCKAIIENKQYIISYGCS